MQNYPGAESFISVLNEKGVENIFFNPGIDTVPVQVTASRLRSEGQKAPRLVLCLDESVAMAAAHGHYMISGKPQVVMAHRELGTLQVGGQWTNVQAGHIPVLFCAGLPGRSGRTTWRGNPYDQGSIVRNNVKWDLEVAADESLADAASKALDVALREPCGPVYLAPCWEAMLNANSKPAAASPPPSASLRKADERLIRQAAQVMLEAKNPLILTGQSGRFAESVPNLVKLAETLGARVLSGPVRVNFPTDHDLCAGLDPIGGGSRSNAHFLGEADALLLIDYDLPYAPMQVSLSDTTTIICLTLDSEKASNALLGRKADIFLPADSREAIPALQAAAQLNLSGPKQKEINSRKALITHENHEARARLKAQAESRSAQAPICSDWLCLCLSRLVDDSTLLVNQTITQSSFVGEQIVRSRPHSLISCAGGSIGWALGAALGAKIASPDRTVVSLMGDGAFIWGCPESTLWTASSYRAPFLSVVFNNRAYAAIKGLVQRAYGEEPLSAQTGFDSGVDIASPPDYARIAEACGAFGTTAKDPAELPRLLKEALEQVKRGRAAVVDVWL